MKCTICNEPIVLIPSAKERVDKFGGKPSDYTKLLTTHSFCLFEERTKQTSGLMKRVY